MNFRSVMIVSCLVIALSGCRPYEVLRGALSVIAPDEDEALAMQCLTDLRARDFDAVKSRLEPSLVSDRLESELTVMANALAHGCAQRFQHYRSSVKSFLWGPRMHTNGHASFSASIATLTVDRKLLIHECVTGRRRVPETDG